ncbi:hypothetical protein BH18ACT5_BH18ACT5_17880 [soil metagenome]
MPSDGSVCDMHRPIIPGLADLGSLSSRSPSELGCIAGYEGQVVIWVSGRSQRLQPSNIVGREVDLKGANILFEMRAAWFRE